LTDKQPDAQMHGATTSLLSFPKKRRLITVV